MSVTEETGNGVIDPKPTDISSHPLAASPDSPPRTHAGGAGLCTCQRLQERLRPGSRLGIDPKGSCPVHNHSSDGHSHSHSPQRQGRNVDRRAELIRNKLVDICEKLQLRLASVERFVEERLNGKNHSVKGEASLARELIIQRLNHVRVACESEEQRLLEVVHAEEERAQQNILTQKTYWSESQEKLLEIKTYLVDTLTKMDDATLLKLQSDIFDRAEEADGIPEPQDSDKLNFNSVCARSHLLDNLWASAAMICTAGVENLHIDERTINRSLILSDNKKVLAFVTKKVHTYPDCPERFDHWPNALTLESFRSGIHAWKVDVGKSCAYKVGVAQNSLSRKSPGLGSRLGYNESSWVFSRYDEEYTVAHHGEPQALDLLKRPTQIGVLVDFEGGEVLFYDPVSCVLIHSFRAKFTDPVYAAFAVADQSIAIVQ